MQIEIQSDALFVSDRLKQIDKDYFITYNTTKNQYELHHRKQVGSTYCLGCPYPCLDERFITLAQKSKIENSKQILKQIEQHNQKIQKQQTQNLIQQLGGEVWKQNKYYHLRVCFLAKKNF